MVTKGGGIKTDRIHQDIYDESVHDGVDILQFY